MEVGSMAGVNAAVPALDRVGFDLESVSPENSPGSAHAMLFAAFGGARPGNRVAGKLVVGFQLVDWDGTNGGKYNRVSFQHPAW
jgi:hypothetical protein